MLGKELVERVFKANLDGLPDRKTTIVRTAIGAFFANLVSELKIPLPVQVFEHDPESMGPAFFYSGVIVGYGKDIPEEAIKGAHRSLTFPSNRAILSRMLYGPGDVTSDGLPASNRAL